LLYQLYLLRVAHWENLKVWCVNRGFRLFRLNLTLNLIKTTDIEKTVEHNKSYLLFVSQSN
jgi:hypothetical protein